MSLSGDTKIKIVQSKVIRATDRVERRTCVDPKGLGAADPVICTDVCALQRRAPALYERDRYVVIAKTS